MQATAALCGKKDVGAFRIRFQWDRPAPRKPGLAGVRQEQLQWMMALGMRPPKEWLDGEDEH